MIMLAISRFLKQPPIVIIIILTYTYSIINVILYIKYITYNIINKLYNNNILLLCLYMIFYSKEFEAHGGCLSAL